MKISVITPSFNSSKYIERAIESVLQQNYENCEHIIVDGGSTDQTLNILKRYQHLKWISEPDKGIYDAMNKGIKLAEGEWIFFLGSDDTFHSSQVLEHIFEDSDNDSFDVLYGNVKSDHFINKSPDGIYDGSFSVDKLLHRNICHQGVFVRKEVFFKHGPFDLHYPVYADWVFNLKWFLDSSIKKKFCDIIVTDYSAGGFSAVQEDPAFWYKRYEIALVYGEHSLSKMFRKELSRKALRSAFHRKDIASFIRNLRLSVKYGLL